MVEQTIQLLSPASHSLSGNVYRYPDPCVTPPPTPNSIEANDMGEGIQLAASDSMRVVELGVGVGVGDNQQAKRFKHSPDPVYI